MDHRPWLPGMAALGVCVLVTACSGNPRGQFPGAIPSQPFPPAAESAVLLVPPDPVAELLATSQQAFEAGERDLALGHLEQARAAFDEAVDVILEAPEAARLDPRVREHLDRLVERIHAHEMIALAQGDGFAEKKYEAATIDELLDLAELAPAPSAGVREAVETGLREAAPDVPVPLNARVLSYVELFQGRLRDWMSEALTRSTQYLPMIQGVFRAEGLPLDLTYVALVESAFKPNALSRAKAKGMWQFMSGTGREHGLKQDWYIDERSDPEKATYAAAKYLRTLNEAFGGDWFLALASYNGGPGRVQRAMKRTGLGDFWKLAGRRGVLPRETREYVPMILAAIIVAKNPAQYGFDIVPAPILAYEKVQVPQAVDLRRIAEWTDSSIDTIQALNPELRRWTTPVRYPGYEIKVPVGTATALRERLALAAPAELVAFNRHAVKRGETLLSIASRHKVSRADLAAANHLSTRARLRVGEELIIPRPPAAALTARLDEPDAATAVAASARTTTSSEPVERARIVYRVKRGDTLFAIARLHQTTVQELKAWNNLRSDRLAIGDRLTIYTTRAAVSAQQ